MADVRFSYETVGLVLRTAYQLAGGRYLKPITFEQIADKLPIPQDEFNLVAAGLRASGYARDTGVTDTLALEHAGLDWVEQTEASEML